MPLLDSPTTIKIPAMNQPVATADIIKLEGYGNYSRLYTHAEPVPVTVSQTLKWFSDQLPTFLRTNKALLVNPRYVRVVVQTSAQTLRLDLTDGTIVDVSRHWIDTIRAQLTTQ